MSFARNAANLGLATLASRVLGFVRDVMVAAALGAGPAADAFVVAFRIPGLLRRLFAEGAFNTAFVPLHGEAAARGEGRLFAEEVFAAVAAGFLLVTALALLAMPLLVALVAPGFARDGGSVELAVALSRITFPYCLATALMVVASAVLNVHGRFTASAYAPALINVVTIAALLAAPHLGWTGQEAAARVLAWAVLIGGLAQCGLVLMALRRAGLGLTLRRPRLTPAVRRFLVLALPGVAAAGITQVNAFVGLVVASPEPGAVAWLYYADRVYQLPLGIVAVAIGVALLPDIVRHSAAGDAAGERHALSRAAEFAAVLSLPAALALMVAATPIVAVLFERGAFGPGDSAATAAALAGFAAGLPAFVAARLLQPLFFARTRMRLPFLVALAGVAADIGLSVALFPSLHQVGIAAAAAASGWLNAALLAWAAWRRGWLRLDAAACRRLPRILAAGLVMAVALAGLVPVLEPWTGTGVPAWLRLAALAALCGGGLAVFLGACLVLGGLDRAGLSAALASRSASAAENTVS
ncbi:murein biosynthesis integral membrane protein MurJ [Labrys wisconsinensis]|uniref:Probable lipid II flippase MurJ n=1 Tax=Labrys wisconsinensis TaxID=425677 RepID=A0ABU0JHF2_9HYPH|nr:murein biosynthesis integral membrane protein MurJ [Labrys wisconsinensis]MDQ0473724.1 putative peptidoglycan lipid II flippase [Labrys wisconsinensis]